MNSEADILEYAGASFRSVWALELLLLLRRSGRSWTPADIIKELRSSRVVVIEALNNLTAAGLAVREEGDEYRYVAAGQAEQLIADLERLYAVKSTLVMRSIVNSPNSKLQMLSNAFRIKE
ncbi:MAG: hypothetical protein JSR72_22235 [Proteobacteria bacterium]|nr:hypothetical protein [Pseudomonadota bacterium]